MSNLLYIYNENYYKLRDSIKNDLEKLKEDIKAGNVVSNVQANNLVFELESLLVLLTKYTQYSVATDEYIVEMTEQNKIRLIGYLIDKL